MKHHQKTVTSVRVGILRNVVLLSEWVGKRSRCLLPVFQFVGSMAGKVWECYWNGKCCSLNLSYFHHGLFSSNSVQPRLLLSVQTFFCVQPVIFQCVLMCISSVLWLWMFMADSQFSVI